MRLQRLVCVFTRQNATLLEIACTGSFVTLYCLTEINRYVVCKDTIFVIHIDVDPFCGLCLRKRLTSNLDSFVLQL